MSPIMGWFRRKKDSESVRQPRLMAGQDTYTFRRSRTITGSLSSEVQAAAEDRSELQSDRLHLHRLQSHRKGLLVALAVVTTTVGALSWLLGQYLPVNERVVYFNAQRPVEASDVAKYTESIERYFKKRPLEHFRFQLNEKALGSAVSKEHSEVSGVRLVDGADGGSLQIELRKPLISWKAAGRQLYIDGEGVAFEKNYFAEPGIVVEDKNNITITGETIVSGRFIRFLGQLVNTLQHDGGAGKVAKIVIPSGTTRQIEVHLQDKKYPIKTHIDRDPRDQAYDVMSAVKYLEGKGISPQYVDVRVEGKAFYR